MHVRSLCLPAAMAALCLAQPVAHAATVTAGFSNGYSVGKNGVSFLGQTNNPRYALVGGNATTDTNGNNQFPSFAVFEVDGSALLAQLRTAAGNASGAVTSINSLQFNSYDQTPYLGGGSGAGSFNFTFATNATPLSVQATNVKYDPTDTGGLTTQLGPTVALASGLTYTPAAAGNTALPSVTIDSVAGDAAVLAAINAGQTFRVLIDANTTTTRAALGGYAGLSTFLLPSTLTVDATVTPEPATLGLASVAAAGLLRRRRTAK